MRPTAQGRIRVGALSVEVEFVRRQRAVQNALSMLIVKEGRVPRVARRERASLESIRALLLLAIGRRTPGLILEMDRKTKTLVNGHRATNGSLPKDGNRASQRKRCVPASGPNANTI